MRVSKGIVNKTEEKEEEEDDDDVDDDDEVDEDDVEDENFCDKKSDNFPPIINARVDGQ